MSTGGADGILIWSEPSAGISIAADDSPLEEEARRARWHHMRQREETKVTLRAMAWYVYIIHIHIYTYYTHIYIYLCFLYMACFCMIFTCICMVLTSRVDLCLDSF